MGTFRSPGKGFAFAPSFPREYSVVALGELE